MAMYLCRFLLNRIRLALGLTMFIKNRLRSDVYVSYNIYVFVDVCYIIDYFPNFNEGERTAGEKK